MTSSKEDKNRHEAKTWKVVSAEDIVGLPFHEIDPDARASVISAARQGLVPPELLSDSIMADVLEVPVEVFTASKQEFLQRVGVPSDVALVDAALLVDTRADDKVVQVSNQLASPAVLLTDYDLFTPFDVQETHAAEAEFFFARKADPTDQLRLRVSLTSGNGTLARLKDGVVVNDGSSLVLGGDYTKTLEFVLGRCSLGSSQLTFIASAFDLPEVFKQWDTEKGMPIFGRLLAALRPAEGSSFDKTLEALLDWISPQQGADWLAMEDALALSGVRSSESGFDMPWRTSTPAVFLRREEGSKAIQFSLFWWNGVPADQQRVEVYLDDVSLGEATLRSGEPIQRYSLVVEERHQGIDISRQTIEWSKESSTVSVRLTAQEV